MDTTNNSVFTNTDMMEAKEDLKKERLKKAVIRTKKMSIGQYRDPNTGEINWNLYPGMSKAPVKGTTRKKTTDTSKRHHRQKKYSKGPLTMEWAPSTSAQESQVTITEDVNEQNISTLDLYIQQLVQHNGYTKVDSLGSILVLEDFSLELKQLQKHLFRCVFRRSIEFTDTHQWLYTCTCEPQRHNLLSNIDSSQHVEYNEFIAEHQPCLHIQACRRLLESIDAISDINAESAFYLTNPSKGSRDHGYAASSRMDCPIFKLNGCYTSPHLGVVITDSRNNCPGVVKYENNQITCLMCKRQCEHTHFLKTFRESMSSDSTPETVQEVLEQFYTSDQSRIPDRRVAYKPSSYRRIPFHLTADLRKKMAAGMKGLVYWDESGMRHILTPHSKFCHKCHGELGDSLLVSSAEDVPVFLRDEIVRADVFCTVCPTCDCVISYDGQDDTLLNMGSYLIGYEVLRDYLNNFLHGHRPVYTYFKVWEDNLDDRGIYHGELTYHKFLNAWYAFLGLLDFDVSAGFSCPVCESLPDGIPRVIICDGTALSFRRDMMTTNVGLTENCSFERSR